VQARPTAAAIALRWRSVRRQDIPAAAPAGVGARIAVPATRGEHEDTTPSMATTAGDVFVAPRAAGHKESGPGTLQRLHDAAPWWLLPVTVVVVLSSFIVYSMWVAHLGVAHAENAPYLSPFYSPTWLSDNIRPPVFPAALALIVPILFRGTCYYYRKAYHRSFFWDPPACTVGELRHRPYHGETAFPLILNNLHRFSMYLAVAYIVILSVDASQAFSYNGKAYLGLGTIIMVVNVILLAGYTFSCHSLRHFVGGGLDCFSCSRAASVRHGIWRAVSRINTIHPLWAWVSLFSVASVDIYIRMLNAGWFSDPHLG
jgi:hypothetical protein